MVFAPTLAMQRLTTEEPDDSMLEVAIFALQRVLLADGIVTVAGAGETEFNG